MSNINVYSQTNAYEEGRFFVMLKQGYSQNLSLTTLANHPLLKDFKVNAFNRAFKTEAAPLNRIYVVEALTDGADEQMPDKLMATGWFEYAERVPLYSLFYTPNDLHTAQWNLKKIMAENAWSIQKGSSNIVIGLVDDALDTAHPDLTSIVWRNAGEIRGNGIDDDGNGYTDDYIGWDFADNDNDPTPGSGLNHGTHCGGIAAAHTDNNKGIASIGFGCRLLIAKVGRSGSGFLFNPYQAVEYAILNKVNVVSMSWGGGSYSYTYQLIFDYAYQQGIVCVAAAGNSSTSISSYPAAYNHVIAVGSTTSGDGVSVFSNYGTWVDVMAPGSNIYSTLPGNNYGYLSGTSMACPLVSGLCGLMLSKNPGLSPDDVEKCLKSGCDNINAGNTSYIGLMGAGRINAENSLKCLKPITADFISNYVRACPGDTIQFTDKTQPTPTAVKWIFQGGTPSTSLAANPKVRYTVSGIYDVQQIVFGNNSSDTLIRKQHITISKPDAVLSGNRTIFAGNQTTIQVNFTGNAPWSVTYTDGTTPITLNNITVTPYFIAVKPLVTTTYALTGMKDRSCTGNVSGSAKVTVKPVSSGCSNALRYQLSLGGAQDDYGYDVSEDAWGNVYVSGHTLSYGNGDGYLAKFNDKGNLLWFKTYGGSSNDVLYKHLPLDDGVLLIGFTASYGAGSDDALVIKTDTSGTVIWGKTIGGSGADWGWNAVLTKDKGFLVYGATTSYGAGDYDNYLMRLDKNGNLKWTKTYGNSYYSSMSGLTTFNDGTAFFCSNYRNSTGGENLVAGIDSNGNLLWGKRFGSSYNDAPYKLTKTDNGNVYVVGANRISSTNQEMYVACFTPSGTNKWIKTIAGSGNESFYSVEPDGNDIILSGFTDSYGAGLSDISIMRMDSSGNILFSKVIGGNQDEVSLSFRKSSDEGYYCVGHTKSFTAGGNDIFLNKLNCSIETGCNLNNYSPTLTNTSMTMYTENQSVSSGGTATSQSISAVKRSINKTVQCKTEGGSSNICLKIDNYTKISSLSKAFTGDLDNSDYFGQAVKNIGDFDGDGIEDIAAGSQYDDDGGSNQGAVYLMMLNANGTIKSKSKISATQGGFTGSLSGHNFFGSSVARIKDLDGDGFDDLVVGHIYDNTGTTRAGAIWVLFMNSDGTVKGHQKIANGTGGFPSILDYDDNFGIDVTDMGDLDGDGFTDIAVGAHLDDDGGSDRGAVYIIYLKGDGTVKSYKKISSTTTGFTGKLINGDGFGYGIGTAHDFNNDGIKDILAGARVDDDGGTDRGAFWIIFLDNNGNIKGSKKYSSTTSTVLAGLKNGDQFGSGVDMIGDINNDGINDIAVSAAYDDDGVSNGGAIWLLLMDNNNDIQSTVKISKSKQRVLNNAIDASDYMGWKVSVLNDIDGNGSKEIVTGAMLDDDGGTDRGAVYIFNLNDSCQYKCQAATLQSKISSSSGGFTGTIDNSDRFGSGVNGIGDIDKDGVQDIAVCADSDDDGGTNLGAVWILFMKSDGTVKSSSKISATQGNFSGNISNGQYFGNRIIPLGDLNKDGVPDIAVSHHYESSSNTRAGAVWILFLKSDGTVKSYQKITSGSGGFTATLQADDKFGMGLEAVGDLNGDGITDIVAGAQDDVSAGLVKGAFYILFLDTNGVVKGYKKIGNGQGGFTGILTNSSRFGFSITSPGDMDQDGVKDLLVGAREDNDGGTKRGAIWSLFMKPDGTVKDYQKISSSDGNIYGIDDNDNLGNDMRNIGDLDKDGIDEIIVSAPYDDDGGADRGAGWVLYLGANGKVRKQVKISSNSSILAGKLDNSDLFGFGIGVIKDLDNDGYNEIVSGAMFDDDGGTDRGAIYIFNFKDTCPKPQQPSICRLNTDFKFSTGCSGDTTYFTDLSTDSLPAIIIRRKWTFGNGMIAEGKALEKLVYKDTGTYKVKLVVYSSSNSNCKDSIIKNVSITNQFKIKGLPDDTICMADSGQLGVASLSCGTAPFRYLWQPATGLERTDILNPRAAPAGTTRYILKVTDKAGSILYDTINVVVDSSCCRSHALFRTDRLFFCENDSVKIINESIVKAGVSYRWTIAAGGNYTSFNGANPPALMFKKSGSYSVRLIINDICNSDTVVHQIYIIPPPHFNAGNDTSLCMPDTIQLGETGIGRNQYLWKPSSDLSDSGSPTPVAIVKSPIIYTVKMITEEGCTAYDTIRISDFASLKLNLGRDTALCDTSAIVLRSNIGAGRYLWNTGANTKAISLKKSGLYWLEISSKQCVKRDSIMIAVPGAGLTLGRDTVLCNEEILWLNAGFASAKLWLWNDGSIGSTKKAVRPGGLYTVKVVSDCGTYYDSIEVGYIACDCDLYFPNSFSPFTTSSLNDVFMPVVGPGCTPDVYELRVYSRWGEELFKSTDIISGWDGTYKGKALPPGAYVFVAILRIPGKYSGQTFQKSGFVILSE